MIFAFIKNWTRCSRCGLTKAEQWEEMLPTSCWLCSFQYTQDIIGILGHQATLLAHGHPVIRQHTHILLCRAPLQQISLYNLY